MPHKNGNTFKGSLAMRKARILRQLKKHGIVSFRSKRLALSAWEHIPPGERKHLILRPLAIEVRR